MSSDPNTTTRGVNLGRPGWTLLASSGSGDGFELFQEVREVPGGPPPHVHRERDEGFYVLEGRYRFWRGTDELEVGTGEAVFVRRGTRHHFETLVAPSRTLIVIAPPRLAEFFRGMGELIAAGDTPLEAMTALSVKFDSHPVP
jgi:mannose-6-phosphate isomerase-like protein (cupin superfamily)